MEIVLSLSPTFLALLPYHMNNDSVSANNVLACIRVNPFCPLNLDHDTENIPRR